MAEKKAPGVERQIRDAKAPKGSPLERMIRQNQDFDLLAPEELDDEYPVPLWLRVAYRKQHPEIAFPDKNPGAVYPEVMSQVFRRMVANPNEKWEGPEAEESPASGSAD
jgi:hypothetical protein